MSKRNIRLVILTIIFLFVGVSGIFAQKSFPSRTIEIVVPSGAGGGQDTLVRVITPLLEAELGVPIKVSNVEGGAHTVGILYSYGAPADGYTVHCLSPSDIISDVFKKISISFVEEFVPLCRFQHDIMVFLTGSNGKFKDIYEVIDYAKENPGAVTIAISSPGGIDDAVVAQFSQQTGAKLTLIPTSGGERLAMTIGGHYDLVAEEPSAVGDLMKSGDLIPLFVATDYRIDKEYLKDAVCSADLGINVTLGTWRGFAVKKGTPQEAIDVLVTAFQNVYNSERYREYEEENLLHLRPGWLGPEDFGKLWVDEVKLYAEIFKELGRL